MTESPPQLLAALHNPACYPHPVEQVQMLQTHISWVLLAGDYAYKIKKPLNLGFLDFTTLERRAYFCHEELRLNRRHAPDLYEAVVAITGTPAQPQFGGHGQVLEYAVCMRRFAANDGFDHLLAAGRLQPQHIQQLAEALAQLHQQAAVASPASRFGTTQQVLAPVWDNFTALRAVLNAPAEQQRLQGLADWTHARALALTPVFEQRRRMGFIRECHGDAHLGNVTLFQGRTTLFDCIEFSDDLRWIDVMNDLSFTVMDLIHRGAPELSGLLLDRYLTLSGDFSGLAVLRFYQVYRALVRAKVISLRLQQPLEAEVEATARIELDEYLHLAEQLAAERHPILVITMGLSGSGKTVLSGQLLQAMGLIRLRSDVERKRLHGLGAEAASHSEMGGGLYTAEVSQLTYAHLLEQADQLLQSGWSVLVDATFLQQSQRQAFRQLAQQRAVPFRLLLCEADKATLKARLLSRAAQGGDASEADLAVLEQQLRHYQPLTAAERADALILDTTAENAVNVACAALETLLADRSVYRRNR